MKNRFVVLDVPEGTPGNSAGICSGDIIEEYDGRRIDGDLSQLILQFQQASGRKSVSLILCRGSQAMHLPVPGGDLGIRLAEAPTSSKSGGPSDFPLVLGLAICFVGTIFAFLYVPCQVFGQSVGWHFVFEEAGFGAKTFDFINWPILLTELFLANGLGVGIIVMSKMAFAGAQQASAAAIPAVQVSADPRIASPSPSPSPSQAPASPPPTNIVAGNQNDLRRCPFCAEYIKKEAIRCRFCKSDIELKGTV